MPTDQIQNDQMPTDQLPIETVSAETMVADVDLLEAIQRELASAADPDKAPAMKKYMKSAMPYLGVTVPAVRAIVRREARQRKFVSAAALDASARALWDTATHREHRYAATELTNVQSARRFQTPELVPLYEHMIVSGAWWDHVDEVSHRIGGLLRSDPDVLRPVVLAWSLSDDRWLRRTSVICQVGAKTSTDLEVLTTVVVANAGDTDFFLRKGIGWALRDYARTDPDWVRGFVAAHVDVLSPLSQREALKHLS
jgi:3-methyladenine DNA glycosylase AlkD